MSTAPSPDPGTVRLRAAVPADVPLILTLIRELAAFERLAHEVVADEAGLGGHLFGPRPAAEVLLAEVRERPEGGAGADAPGGWAAVGFALFFPNFSTFRGRPGLYLEDLYVRPAHRGRGIGKTLLVRLAQLARERGCGRFEWTVLDWNEHAIRFYEQLGAQRLEDWTICRVTGPALEKLAAGGA